MTTAWKCERDLAGPQALAFLTEAEAAGLPRPTVEIPEWKLRAMRKGEVVTVDAGPSIRFACPRGLRVAFACIRPERGASSGGLYDVAAGQGLPAQVPLPPDFVAQALAWLTGGGAAGQV